MRFFQQFILVFCLALMAGVNMSYAGNPTKETDDSLIVSLMTCAPGTEVYAQYGHTAIRIQNTHTGDDWCFNYGVFSFRTPHFLYRFVKGDTEYQLGVMPYSYFKEEYQERGSAVYQQVLNLTPAEKLKLWNLLDENYLPENRTYLYNFFYDNCTTRARDRIEEAIQGKVQYPVWKTAKTYRDIMHQYTAEYPWAQFGADLCLGADADKPLTERQQMFAPLYLRKAFEEASIVGTHGEKRPLVAEEVVVPPYHEITAEEKAEFPLTPMACALILLGVVIAVSVLEWKRRKIYWGVDLLLFAAQGLTGCIIAFLFFFSSHPTVGSNWLLILFNPIPLLYLPVEIYSTIKRKKDYYHCYNIIILVLFILSWTIIPQKFNLVVLPLAVVLMCPSVVHLLLRHKRA